MLLVMKAEQFRTLKLLLRDLATDLVDATDKPNTYNCRETSAGSFKSKISVSYDGKQATIHIPDELIEVRK